MSGATGGLKPETFRWYQFRMTQVKETLFTCLYLFLIQKGFKNTGRLTKDKQGQGIQD